MKKTMPKDLCVGDRIQFESEAGIVVSNKAAKPSTKYDLHSRIIEVEFKGKQNLEIRFKGSDTVNVIAGINEI